MKTYTEQDLRLAFRAGINMGKYLEAKDKYYKPMDEEDYIGGINPEIEESTIGFTFGYLQRKFDWDDICTITGLSYYCRNKGFEIEDSEVFNIKESIAKQFNLI